MEESIGVEVRVQGDSNQETPLSKNTDRIMRVGRETEELCQRKYKIEASKKTWLSAISKCKCIVNILTSLHDSILEISFSDAIQQSILKMAIGVLQRREGFCPRDQHRRRYCYLISI
jgi:hypothetical protein